MYRFPEGFDGGFLLGKTLELVCFSANQVCLHFNDNVLIVIEEAFSYRQINNGDKAEVVQEVPVKDSNLMQLLEQTVSDVLTNTDGTLTLRFGNGDVVRCFAAATNYECYHIWNGDVHVVL